MWWRERCHVLPPFRLRFKLSDARCAESGVLKLMIFYQEPVHQLDLFASSAIRATGLWPVGCDQIIPPAAWPRF
jgi:hypothetical protein